MEDTLQPTVWKVAAPWCSKRMRLSPNDATTPGSSKTLDSFTLPLCTTASTQTGTSLVCTQQTQTEPLPSLTTTTTQTEPSTITLGNAMPGASVESAVAEWLQDIYKNMNTMETTDGRAGNGGQSDSQDAKSLTVEAANMNAITTTWKTTYTNVKLDTSKMRSVDGKPLDSVTREASKMEVVARKWKPASNNMKRQAKRVKALGKKTTVKKHGYANLRGPGAYHHRKPQQSHSDMPGDSTYNDHDRPDVDYHSSRDNDWHSAHDSDSYHSAWENDWHSSHDSDNFNSKWDNDRSSARESDSCYQRRSEKDSYHDVRNDIAFIRSTSADDLRDHNEDSSHDSDYYHLAPRSDDYGSMRDDTVFYDGRADAAFLRALDNLDFYKTSRSKFSYTRGSHQNSTRDDNGKSRKDDGRHADFYYGRTEAGIGHAHDNKPSSTREDQDFYTRKSRQDDYRRKDVEFYDGRSSDSRGTLHKDSITHYLTTAVKEESPHILDNLDYNLERYLAEQEEWENGSNHKDSRYVTCRNSFEDRRFVKFNNK